MASDGSGGAVVAGVTIDTENGVNYYDTGSKKWFAIGAPNGPVTSVTVTGQGIIVATDTYGQPWYFVPADRPTRTGSISADPATSSSPSATRSMR